MCFKKFIELNSRTNLIICKLYLKNHDFKIKSPPQTLFLILLSCVIILNSSPDTFSSHCLYIENQSLVFPRSQFSSCSPPSFP